jgi:3-oxoisoapionate kinase
VPFDAAAVCREGPDLAAEEARVVRSACEAAARGQSPLVHSASGTGDPAVRRFRDALSASRLAPEEANRRIGEALGRILDAVLRETGLRRAVISGGDTSGHGMRQLGLVALEALAPTIPGAALCRAHGAGRARRARDRAQGRADGIGRLLRLDPRRRRAALISPGRRPACGRGRSPA